MASTVGLAIRCSEESAIVMPVYLGHGKTRDGFHFISFPCPICNKFHAVVNVPSAEIVSVRTVTSDEEHNFEAMNADRVWDGDNV